MDYVRRARLKIFAHVERLALMLIRNSRSWCPTRPTKERRNGSSGFGLRRSIGIAHSTSSRATPNSRLNKLSLLFVNNCSDWKRRTRLCAHGWRTPERMTEAQRPPLPPLRLKAQSRKFVLLKTAGTATRRGSLWHRHGRTSGGIRRSHALAQCRSCRKVPRNKRRELIAR